MEDIPFRDFDIRKVFYQKVKMYADMYQSSCLIRTSLWIAHNRFISVFNILKKKWTNHAVFSEHITVFRKKEDEELYNPGVMYPDGSFYTKVKQTVETGTSPDGNYSFVGVEPDCKLSGKPI